MCLYIYIYIYIYIERERDMNIYVILYCAVDLADLHGEGRRAVVGGPSLKEITPFTRAFALQNSSRNC